METHSFKTLFRIGAIVLLGVTFGCEPSFDELEQASYPVDGNIFLDGFSGGLEYAAFGGSDVTAFQVVDEGAYKGTSVMRFSVPDFDSPTGAYAGGAFYVPGGRDLSGFTVLTFWAKASKSANIDVLGFGNDLGANQYVTTVYNTPVNTNWKQYYIPIPDPEKLTKEGGMFFYSEGPENGEGYTFWIDEVRFEDLGTIALENAGVFGGTDSAIVSETGATFSAEGFVDFSLPNGTIQRVSAAPAYYEYATSDPTVATIAPDGTITVMDAGEAVITAKLGDRDAIGSLTITSTGEAIRPQTAATTPTLPSDDVISIFSDAYDDEPIDYLNGYWIGDGSTTLSEIIEIEGDEVVRYSQLNFVGIQFTAPTIDVSGMTHIHMDLWTPDPTALPAEFKILLIDLGPDNSFEGSDGSSHTITLKSPTLQTEQWISVDIPLSEFFGLTTLNNLAQIGLSGNLPNMFVDNIYFYDDGQGGGPVAGLPATAAPTPTQPASSVRSIYSNQYTNEPIDFLNGYWQFSTTQSVEIKIDGDDVIRYSDLNFVGIEFTNPTIDVSTMTHFHIDIWTPDPTALPAEFKVKLRDFGPNGSYDQNGDDSEDELTFKSPTLQTGSWVSLDIPLSDFTALTGTSNMAQIVLSGDLPNVFVDNMYFYAQ